MDGDRIRVGRVGNSPFRSRRVSRTCRKGSVRRLGPLTSARRQPFAEEFYRRLAAALVNGGAIHARRVDAGLGKLVAPLAVAFIDEDLVIDQAGYDGKLGARNVFGGEH